MNTQENPNTIKNLEAVFAYIARQTLRDPIATRES